MAVISTDSPHVDGNTLIVGALLDGQAGEDIPEPGMPCTYDANGNIVLSNGSAANAAAGIAGVSTRAALQGEPMTLGPAGTRVMLDKNGGLTPGDVLYVSGTPGAWDDASPLGDTGGTALVISSTTIVVLATRPQGA